MTRTVCFHHNDTDGRASGAIVRYALGPEVQLIESDYDGTPINWEAVERAERVVVVDFSFSMPEMLRMAEGRQMAWIDHHKSALAEFQEVAVGWAGLRDSSEAACVLCWKYFFPERPTPRAVVLIGDRDVWRWAEADTGAFNEGLYVLDSRVQNDDLWRKLLEDDPQTVDGIVREGQRLREIHLNDVARMVKARGFAVRFEGHHTLAVNAPGDGDIGQRGRDLGYKVVYCYVDQLQNGRLYTNVTLFSREVDVSVIARKYGGGGHAGASGFSFPRDKSPFPDESVVKWE